MEKRGRRGLRVSTAILFGALVAVAAAARAGDSQLLDVLRQKHVLTDREYERLEGSELTPAQRSGLIEILRQKGILEKDEADALQSSASPPPRGGAVEAKEAPVSLPQVGYDEGFFIRTRDGSLDLRLGGRVASNFLFVEPGTTQNDTETIDRARLGVDASFYEYFRVRLENDFTSRSGLRDAFIAIRPAPEANVQLGQFKVPFSHEELRSKRYIDFVERAAVVNSTVNPSRDIGAMLYGRLGGDLLQYQLAGMNGAGQNRHDDNSDKDVVARLVLAPLADVGPSFLRGVDLGGAVTWGNQPADSAATASSISGVTETGFSFFPAVARSGKRLRWDLQGAWVNGPYSLSGEYIETDEGRDGLGDAGTDLPGLHTDGAYVGGTWLVTGENKLPNSRLHPARPLWDSQKPGWGAWEVAWRYEYYRLRHGAGVAGGGQMDPALANRYDAIVAGMNWYPNEFLRFSLNYLYGHFDKTGRGLSPDPAKHSNNAVLGRAQLEF